MTSYRGWPLSALMVLSLKRRFTMPNPHKLNVPRNTQPVNTDIDIDELTVACKEYVWYCLISQDGGGYYAETRRCETHDKIAEALGVECKDPYLCDLVHNLDKIGFPAEQPGHESWIRIARSVAAKMVEHLTQTGGGE